MRRIVFLNGLMNFVFGVIFVFLNSWALQNKLEETFVSLAVFYSVVVLLGNVLYISIFCKSR